MTPEEKLQLEKELSDLFHEYLTAVLQGRFSDSLTLADENYTAVGLCNQVVVYGREQAAKLLPDSSLLNRADQVHYQLCAPLNINVICQHSAIVMGTVNISSSPPEGEPLSAEMVQTLLLSRGEEGWRIAYSHATPTNLNLANIKAFPSHFLDETISALKAELAAELDLPRDPLTGILNREGFLRHSSARLNAQGLNQATALLLVDLDDFKQINDRMGHQTGDIVLQEVARSLSATFRSSDTVGRFGGDEFMVLLCGDFSLNFLEEKAEHLLRSLHLQIDEGQLSISVSIGIAFGLGATDFDRLYRNADVALYAAKQAGKRRYHLLNTDGSARQSCETSSTTPLLSLQQLLIATGVQEPIERKTPYETLVENLPGGVVIYELRGDSIIASQHNDWLSRFLGYSQEEICTLQAEDSYCFVHPEDLAPLQAAIQGIRDGQSRCTNVYRMRHKAGHYLYMNQVLTVSERRRGSITVFAIESDVDEAMRLRQELQNSKSKLESFMAAIPGGVLDISISDCIRISHRNGWLARHLGYTPEELDQLEFDNSLALMHSEDIGPLQQGVVELCTHLLPGSFIYRLRSKDGRYRKVRINTSFRERHETELIFYGVVTAADELATSPGTVMFDTN